MVFAAGLAAVAALYFWTKLSHTALFWAAFILTRPLGAAVGDWLDKPVVQGGMALSRYTASAVLVGFHPRVRCAGAGQGGAAGRKVTALAAGRRRNYQILTRASGFRYWPSPGCTPNTAYQGSKFRTLRTR
jgi:hypothetical protein